jgi:hypothetical protein
MVVLHGDVAQELKHICAYPLLPQQTRHDYILATETVFFRHSD